MASVIHGELLQPQLLKLCLQFQNFGFCSGIEKRPPAIHVFMQTRFPYCREESAFGVPSSVKSCQSDRKRFATYVKVSQAQTNGYRTGNTGVESRVELQESSTRREFSDGIRAKDAEQGLHQRRSAAPIRRKPHGRRPRGDEVITDGGSKESSGEGTISILESKRMKRSRITKELLLQGKSPVQILEDMECCDSGKFWNVVNILCYNKRTPEALLLFDWWKRQPWYVLDEQNYTTFISICGRAGLPDDGQKLFDEMKRLDLRPSVATYSCLLQGFAEVGDFNKAKEILVEMREVGLSPNAITYTGLLLAYGKQGYYSEMAKVFNDMKTYAVSRPECAPTSVTYSALLQCFATGGLFSRMEKVLKEMMSKELVPDSAAVNSIIQGYGQAGLIKEMEKAYSLVRPFKAIVRLDTVRAMASAYIRKSYFYQLGIYARYLYKKRVAMGTLIENLLLLSHAANFSMRGLAEEYVRMKESGFRGDTTSFNIRALAFSRMQMFWDLRVNILEMVDQGVVPDLVTYGAVVDAYVEGKLQTNLAEALGEMPNLATVVKNETDELVFEAFGRGDFQICCEDLVQSMEDTDRKFLTYSNLVGYYLKRSEILSAQKQRKKFGRL